MSEPDIIPNKDLTPEERADILRRYINRDTLDSPWTDQTRRILGKARPTLTDQQWIDAHVWQRRPDGKIVIVGSV